MDAILKDGKVHRGWLGAALQELDRDLAQSFGFDGSDGVLIGDVQPDGPAPRAGLGSGDIVLRFEDKPTRNTREFRNQIAALGIGALTVAGVPHGSVLAFAIVAVAMGLGGLVAGRKVLETLSHKVTPLPLAESLTASVTTASLVSAASWFRLPVSTTHVSTGAIVGAGLKNDPRAVRWSTVGELVLSWLVTLPVAAILAGAAKYLVR